MTVYSVKMPDMSRNIALAGQTVSSRGMNITYDENGYAVKATHYGSKFFAQTEQSVRAASVDAVLGSAQRASYVGSTYDRDHFSDTELAYAEELSRRVADGSLSAEEYNIHMENVRALYGYSGGATGAEYIALAHNKQPGQVLAEQRAARQAVAQSEPAAADEAVHSSAPAAEAAQAAASAEAVQSGVTGAEAIQSAPAAAQTEETPLETYQTQLTRQQQTRSLQNELAQLQNDALLRSYAEKMKSELTDLIFRDEEDK
ncbi:MAG: hypothetical protein E7474_05970 [Ruminococcaceae bacterium]|nr:hypothetical protein [Oscillospiraceae bacterium]